VLRKQVDDFRFRLTIGFRTKKQDLVQVLQNCTNNPVQAIFVFSTRGEGEE
jgi:hypothetical protein